MKKDDLVSVSETCEGDPAIIHSALSQLPSIVLSPTPGEGTATAEPRTAPSSPTHSQGPDTPSRKTAATFEEDDLLLSEDLMSSASFLGSSSDLARSPTLTASSSVSTFELPDSEEADMDASMISASEIEVDGGHESIAGLRRRRRPSQVEGPNGFSSALASSLHGYEADNDHSFNDDVDSLHALDESMFSDPDIEGLAFQPFPSSSSSRATEPRTPPRDDRRTSRSGNVIVSASSPPDSPSQLPPRRTVIVDELILRALELSRRYPVGSSTASSDLLVSSAVTEAAAPAVDADASVHFASSAVATDDAAVSHRVLGANSCINTWYRSMNGTLTDAEAETIVRNGEGIVFVDALGPDSDETETPADGDDESLDEFGDADADEYDIVPSPGDADAGHGRRRRRRNRRSSSTRGGGRIPPLLALGPHGWLVVSGVAVAAVAYGVYRQQGGAAAAAAASSGAHGLGTARLGLGLGFGGGFGGAAAAAGVPAAVDGV